MSQDTNPFMPPPSAAERWTTRVCVTIIFSGTAILLVLLFYGRH